MPDPRQFARTLFHIPEELDAKVEDYPKSLSLLPYEWEETDSEPGKPQTPPPKPIVYAYDAHKKLVQLQAKRVTLDPEIEEARAMQAQAYNVFIKKYKSRSKVGWRKTPENEAWWKDWRAEDDFWGGKLHEAERQAKFLDEDIEKTMKVLAEAEEREAHLRASPQVSHPGNSD